MRRALARIDEHARPAWLRPALMSSVREALDLDWILDDLGDKTPALVRGDSDYGNEGILVALEQRQQPYLLRLRQTANVQRLVRRQFDRLDWSRTDSQGFQAIQDEVKLSGWSQARRVVILRRRLREGIARKTMDDHGQLRLDFADHHILDAVRMWEYTVLVTNADYRLESIAQLYRDRCDCENGFDELKNQWGLSGFTTRDLNRSQTTARAGALIYNWWSWYCRPAHPGGRLEAITSRPLLLAAVGKTASHAGQTTLYLTSMHTRTDTINQLLVNIRAALRHVRSTAEQFRDVDRWGTLLKYVCQKITPRMDDHSACLTPLLTG